MIAGLEVRNLRVRFSEVIAVDDLSLDAPYGQITGLIGPNGAGKTTTFNACCGLIPHEGEIRFRGEDLGSRSPAHRARLGLGRTFQRIELCDGLTVVENVALGAECRKAGVHVWSQLSAGRRERRSILDGASAALERCGVGALADVPCGQLSTGQRRMVELARAIASEFSFLLLDEPSSGLDHHETVMFGELLTDLAADGSRGLLVVEHDMSLVRQTCTNAWVMDFGQLIMSGSTRDVLASDAVKLAYLGTSEVAAVA
jgi:ABC-type branched-subunit amino acid transport system ATPase component